MTISLKALRKLGVIPRTTHRWTKLAQQARAEYIDKFENRPVPKHLDFITVSERAKRMLRDVNIDVVGNKMVFPSQHHKVVVRETKYGMIIKATNKHGTQYEIILAEDLDHVKYARKLGKKKNKEGIESVWGTLKSVEYKVANGKTKRGYMRDMSALRPDFDDALEDRRYKIDQAQDNEVMRNADVTAMIRLTM